MSFINAIWKSHTSIARRVFLRTILFATAMAIFPFLQLPCNNKEIMVTYEQFLKPISSYALPAFLAYKENDKNLITEMFREIMDMNLLNSNVELAALCVGEGSALAVSELRRLGFTNAKLHSSFSFLKRRKTLIPELDLDDLDCNSFDFVFSRAPSSRVSVPAMFVTETERILKSGGIGVIVLGMMTTTLNPPGSLIKTATPVSIFLKTSDVVRVSSVDSFLIVAFKKKQDNPFEHYQLPDECSSIKNTKPLMEHLEPLGSREGNFSYLPNLLDVSSRNRFIYIYIDLGGPVKFVINPNDVITNRFFFNSYPMDSRDFNIYVVDPGTTLMITSYVNNPGSITFVYHPDLDQGSEELYDEWFDFLDWFKSIVTDGDFVVLKMNAAAAGVELKFLHELFETGAICLVDELFLHCPETADIDGGALGDCVDMFEGLRSRGVFVHQWRRDDT